MDARDRRAARARPGPARHAIGAWGTATILVASLAWGCGTRPVPSPTPAPSASPAPTVTPAPTPSPTPAYADTLRVGWSDDDPGFRVYWGIEFPNQIYPAAFVYSGLFRYDAQFGAVPDLADGPCLPQADPKVVRCRLVEATFQDGTPLTADDVAYSYRLFAKDPWDMAGSLKEVRVVDPRTVDFVLSSVDPTFVTMYLENQIFPQHAVEASYAAFLARTKDLRAKDLAKLADTIDTDASRTPPVCTPHVAEATALLEKIGAHLYKEDFSRGATGQFDACGYLGTASYLIRQAADALGKTGLDAVAAALALLSIDRRPVGAGPYRYVSDDANGIHLEAWPGYHGGLAATRYLDFVPTKPDGSDLLDGTVDIFQTAPHDAAYQATAASHGVRFATVLSTDMYYFLAFHVRPGRLFADLNLRKALQRCVDLPRDVEAATGGAGTPIYGPVLPSSWAYDPDLPKPARDIAAARRLIEGAGWQLGADGVYAKGKVRLAAQIVVRSDDARRVKMADLIALQARDCGMDLKSHPVNYAVLWRTLNQYPHDIPGTKTPFDLYLAAWPFIFDPGNLTQFTSSNITDAKHPDGNTYANSIGFSDPVVDRLEAAEMSTYDQAERASLLRQEQAEIAAQLPWLFLWTDYNYNAVRSAVTTVDGPLDLTTPNWGRDQLTRMVVLASSP